MAYLDVFERIFAARTRRLAAVIVSGTLDFRRVVVRRVKYRNPSVGDVLGGKQGELVPFYDVRWKLEGRAERHVEYGYCNNVCSAN